MSPSLSESAFWVLTALAREPLHGYAILRSVEDLSDGGPMLRVTTLYATLERLQQDGLVRVVAEGVVDGRARRTYDITDGGRRALAGEAERLHGLAERFTPSSAVGFAVAGLACFVLGFAGTWALADGATGSAPAVATSIAHVATAGFAPALVSLSALALLRHGGVVGVAGTVGAGLLAVAAWAAAALAALSWSVGFDRAGAGLPPTTSSAAFPVLLVVALVLGAAALTPVWNGVLRGVRPPGLRGPVVVACALFSAVALGVASVTPGPGAVTAVVLLVTSLVVRRPRTRFPERPDATPVFLTSTAAAPGPRGGPPPLTPALRRRVAALSALGVLLGVPSALHVFLGGPATSFAGVLGLPGVNLGWAAGTLAAIPGVLAGGVLAARQWGRCVNRVTAAVVGALALTCFARLQGPDGPLAPLFLAALLAALAVVSVVRERLPGRWWSRWALVVLIGSVAAWTVALPLVVVAPLGAPVLTAVLLVRVLRAPGVRVRST
ncbi:helix-turn-helix transcriptional regulator [Kineococcus sp. LSe6-4]|uniref:Helix-turn-helix transcriptional regulator n=1 Tax=Kineococcus halophytocola TaxID=3234027 RepID=A0ABV4GXX6_9ACTN